MSEETYEPENEAEYDPNAPYVPYKFTFPRRAQTGTKITITVSPITRAFTLALYANPRVETIVGDSKKRKARRGDLVLVAQEDASPDGKLSLILKKGGENLRTGNYLLRAWAAHEVDGRANSMTGPFDIN